MNLAIWIRQVNRAPANLIIAYGGQSNAGVRGDAGFLINTPYSSYPGTYSNTHYINNLGYTTRQVYARAAATSQHIIGAEIGIVNQLTSKFTTIEIIDYYVGSTAIKFTSGTATFYPGISGGYFELGFYKSNNSSFWQVNLAAITQTKPNCIIWIQGEQDAVLGSTTYLADITAMVTAMRNGYGDQTIPFFYNKLHVDFYKINGVAQYPTGTANVRAAQVSFQSTYNIMISMDDMAIGDPDGVNVHYSSTALAEMGKRFATAIKTYYHIT